MIKNGFWKNKRVLVTGHTGFKGSWLSLWLDELGAEVTGIALPPPSEPSLFHTANIEQCLSSKIGDIRDLQEVIAVVEACKPEIVFHLAAQSLVRESYEIPVETYATNVMGTLHVLEAIRKVTTVRSAVMVTTDKCYDNTERLEPYREDEPMGGYDMYSSSKGCAELLIASYRRSFFPIENFSEHRTAIASARAGNVIGGGDWAKDRLVPDIVRAFQSRQAVHIRNPHAVRPWQHVLEPLSGYLLLAERLHRDGMAFSEAWNFGPDLADAQDVGKVTEIAAGIWGSEAQWAKDDGFHPHEANYLKLDSSKARSRLGWMPRWNLEQALKQVVDWHKAEASNADMRQYCLNSIASYTNDGVDQ